MAVAGPGLGWHGDYAQFNKQGKYQGIANIGGVNTTYQAPPQPQIQQRRRKLFGG